MIVKIDDKVYRVWWKHDLEKDSFNVHNLKKEGYFNKFHDYLDEKSVNKIIKIFEDNTARRTTTCFIADATNGVILMSGKSLCSNKDKFVKHIGRVVSLENALNGFKEGDRRAFWFSYFNRK